MSYGDIIVIAPKTDTLRFELTRFEKKLKESSWDQNYSLLEHRIESLRCTGNEFDVKLNLQLCGLVRAKYIVVNPLMGEDALYSYFDNFTNFINNGIISASCELIYYNYFCYQNNTDRLSPFFPNNELKSIVHNYNMTSLDILEEVINYIRNK